MKHAFSQQLLQQQTKPVPLPPWPLQVPLHTAFTTRGIPPVEPSHSSMEARQTLQLSKMVSSSTEDGTMPDPEPNHAHYP